MKLLLENWRKFLTESNCSLYRTGMCDAYAIAQHQMTGLPIFLIQGKWWDDEYEEWATEPCHLVVKDEESGKYIDVGGEKTEEELKQDCHFMNADKIEEIEFVKVSPEEAREIFTTEGVSDEEIEDAKNFIEKEKRDETFT